MILEREQAAILREQEWFTNEYTRRISLRRKCKKRECGQETLWRWRLLPA